ncbi:hypothetical protein F3D3_4266 [Fusibacter sp. 3D3]|nr:hypothetical protein F3D3_4266 [Fusibacter sp. 3D3]
MQVDFILLHFTNSLFFQRSSHIYFVYYFNFEFKLAKIKKRL